MRFIISVLFILKLLLISNISKADNFLGNCNIGNEGQYLNTALQLVDEFYKGHVFVCQCCGREAVKYSPCSENILENCTPPPNFEE